MGYYVANNLYYVDLDEDKGREIDLRALKNYDFKIESKQYFVRHLLLIECKKSSKKPWVIFTSPETSYDSEYFDVDCSGADFDAEMEGMKKAKPSTCALPAINSLNWKKIRENVIATLMTTI